MVQTAQEPFFFFFFFFFSFNRFVFKFKIIIIVKRDSESAKRLQARWACTAATACERPPPPRVRYKK